MKCSFKMTPNGTLSKRQASTNHYTCLYLLCPSGKTHTFSPDAKSVSPAWRTAKLSGGCGAGWADPREDNIWPYKLVEYAKDTYSKYGKGVYYNEAGFFLKDFKV